MKLWNAIAWHKRFVTLLKNTLVVYHTNESLNVFFEQVRLQLSNCAFLSVNNQKHMKLMSENEFLGRELDQARSKIADMTRELEASQAIIEVCCLSLRIVLTLIDVSYIWIKVQFLVTVIIESIIINSSCSYTYIVFEWNWSYSWSDVQLMLC